MLKPGAARRVHWIAFALASLCLLLGGGIASSPGCSTGQPDLRNEDSWILRDWGIVPPHWRLYYNDILIRDMSKPDGDMVYSISIDGTSVEAFLGPDANKRAGIAPDWSRLVYAHWEQGSEMTGRKNWEIFTSDPDGSKERRLTNLDSLELAPAWSPDGSRIAFYSKWDIDGLLHLYTMASDGSEQREIAPTNNRGGITPPLWSPDGRRITFVTAGSDLLEGSNYSYYPMDLYIAEADGSAMYSLGKTITLPAWSPDSSRIAFLIPAPPGGDITIYTVGADGSNPAKVTEIVRGFYRPEPELDHYLEWSPDGTKILVSHGGAIGTVNVDGSDFRQLTDFSEIWDTKVRASWSPDGSKIVVAVAHRNIFTKARQFSRDKSVALFTMNADGTNRQISMWWMTGGGPGVEPGHNEPWPDNLKWLEPMYDPLPARTPRATLKPTPQPQEPRTTVAEEYRND